MTTTTVGLHIATVRHFDPGSGIATVVVPALYGDVPIEARPFLSSPDEAANLPMLDPGDTVIAFYDGGDPMTLLRWYLTGGHDSGSTGGGTGGGVSAEDAVDAVATALRAGLGIAISYNDPANTLTIANTAAGLDTEGVIDAVAASLTAGTGITITYNDPAGTIALDVDVNEVWVGPSDPIAGRLTAATELWYDTDATALAATPVVNSTFIGEIRMFTGDVAPAMWMLCQGQEVSRTTYPELWSVQGAKWGGGDGSTTFNLPDYRDRAPVGFAPGGAYATAVGKLGGSKDASLVQHQHGGGSHAHGVNFWSGYVNTDHAHFVNSNTGTEDSFHDHNIHGVQNSGTGYDTAALGRVGDDSQYGAVWSSGAQNSLHWHNVQGWTGGISANHQHPINGNSDPSGVLTDLQGGAATDRNLMPYATVNFIIRVLL